MGSKQAYHVVHQPVSRGLAVFADAWLSGWLAEINSDLNGSALGGSTTMRYTNPRLYFFTFSNAGDMKNSGASCNTGISSYGKRKADHWDQGNSATTSCFEATTYRRDVLACWAYAVRLIWTVLISYRSLLSVTQGRRSWIPVLDYPVRKVTVSCVLRAVADYKNAVVDGRRAVGTGIYPARVHLTSISCTNTMLASQALPLDSRCRYSG